MRRLALAGEAGVGRGRQHDGVAGLGERGALLPRHVAELLTDARRGGRLAAAGPERQRERDGERGDPHAEGVPRPGPRDKRRRRRATRAVARHLYFARASVDAAAMTTFLRALAAAPLLVALCAAPALADTSAAATIKPSAATAKAPPVYKVKFATTKGDFVVEVHRDWAPIGADRFYNLVKLGFFSDAAFFRVIKGFMVQFGIPADPAVARQWESATIKDDPVKQSNTRGMITFATAGPDMRTTQVFINYANNHNLDSMGFAPFGKVVQGMKVVDAIDGRYGEGFPEGKGPAQDQIQREGNAYLKAKFPKLDYVKSATLVP